jgi:uracil-DNA glycosylase family 4
VPVLPAARRLAREGRPREEGRLLGRVLLGPSRPRLRRPDSKGRRPRLRPRAHGANRTGRFFTGDRSGDFLFAALHRAGLANQPVSRHREDGLCLKGLWISAAVRCAPPQNKPTPTERDTCLPYAARELELLDTKIVVCLGAFAWDAALRIFEFSPKPKFTHGAEATAGAVSLLGCYHPSQQNTFTGVLTPAMLDAVLQRARGLAARR